MPEFRAVIYARYSSHNQTEQSIEGQLRACTAYAEREGMRIVGSFIDRDMTGKNDDRQKFQSMLAAAETSAFDVILVYSLDRFARNRYDSAVHKRRLRAFNVRVLSVSESIPDGPEGILLESVLEGIAEYFSEELARKVRRGMDESAMKGQSTGGSIPIGYFVRNRRYEIDPTTAPGVLELFTRYAAGDEVKDILARAATIGLRTKPTRRTPNGAAINATSLRSILANKKYLGIMKFGAIETPDAIPALIDQPTFDQCAKRTGERKTIARSGKATIQYLLTSKLRCGTCGAFYIGDSGTGARGSTYRYYCCAGRKTGRAGKPANACPGRRLVKENIEQFVVEYTARNVLDDLTIARIAKAAEAAQISDRSTLDSLIARAGQTRDDIRSIMEAIKQGIITKSTKSSLLALEQQEETIQAQIDDERLRIDVPKITAAYIAHWLRDFSNGDAKNPDFQKKLIDALINQVQVFSDHLIIVYNYKDGTVQVDLCDLPTGTVFSCSDSDPIGEAINIYPNFFTAFARYP